MDRSCRPCLRWCDLAPRGILCPSYRDPSFGPFARGGDGLQRCDFFSCFVFLFPAFLLFVLDDRVVETDGRSVPFRLRSLLRLRIFNEFGKGLPSIALQLELCPSVLHRKLLCGGGGGGLKKKGVSGRNRISRSERSTAAEDD